MTDERAVTRNWGRTRKMLWQLLESSRRRQQRCEERMEGRGEDQKKKEKDGERTQE